MFEKIGSLPLHPLAVHAPVILVPALAVVAVVYAFVPSWRPKVTWAVWLLAIAAPITTTVAVLSGRELEQILGQTQETNEHQGFGEYGWYVSIALAVATLGLWWLKRIERADRPQPSQARLAMVDVALKTLIAVCAVLAIYYVVRAGHSGADMRWGDLL